MYYIVAGMRGYERFETKEAALAKAKVVAKEIGWTTLKTMQEAKNWGDDDVLVKTEYVDR